MQFYRVQTIDGDGPFYGTDWSEDYDYAARCERERLGHYVKPDRLGEDADEYYEDYDCWSILDHPSPSCGTEYGSPLHKLVNSDTDTAYRFGFVSLEQFKEVFQYTFANKSAGKDYFLYCWMVDPTEVVQGYTQAVCNLSALKCDSLFYVKPLTECEGKY